MLPATSRDRSTTRIPSSGAGAVGSNVIRGIMFALLDAPIFRRAAVSASDDVAKRTIGQIACLLLTTLIVACSAPAPTAVGDSIVYVVRREWHTDIGLPVQEIAGPLATLEKPFPGARYLTFGFGERQFLIDHRKDLFAMLSALLPSQSAMLMTALTATPEQAFDSPNVIVLHVSRAGLASIEAAIWNEIERTPSGEPIVLADGPYPGSVFYAARDTYYGLYTCNTWTAGILRTGGLQMPATGVLFAGQVMGAAAWIGMHQTVPSATGEPAKRFP